MGKGGDSNWELLGSHSNSDGTTTDYYGDPNGELAEVWGWVDGQPPAQSTMPPGTTAPPPRKDKPKKKKKDK